MYKANFRLEVITPLMMSSGEIIPNGGTYTKAKSTTTIEMTKEIKTVELRASSIKGVMRWWYRAIVGADNNIEQLKKSEDEIFGSTDGGSKIRIKIEDPNLRIDEWKDQFWRDYRCSNVKGKNYPINGYQYLAYTNFVKSTKYQKTAVRRFIKPTSTFALLIVSRDKKAFESALISFWFALHFGGFGNRARRGFGKLQAIQADISSKPLEDDILKYFNFCCCGDLDSHKKIINQGIEGWKEYRKRNGISNTPSTKYTNIMNAQLFFLENKANFNCKEKLDKTPHTIWESALNEAGKRFQYFRQEYKGDKEEILKKDKVNINNIKKPVFGLPIGYRFQNGYKATVKHQEDKNKGIGDRFASPVWISIHKIGNNYYPAFLFMFSNSAQGMEITVNNKYGKYQQNNTVFNEFIKQGLDKITAIEFKP